jgi:hypothetical protein
MKKKGVGLVPGQSLLAGPGSLIAWNSRKEGDSGYRQGFVPDALSDGRGLLDKLMAIYLPGEPLFGAEWQGLVDEALDYLAKNFPRLVTDFPGEWDGVPTPGERLLASMLLASDTTVSQVPAGEKRGLSSKIIRLYAEKAPPGTSFPWAPSSKPERPRPSRPPRPITPPPGPPATDLKPLEGRVARLEDTMKKLLLALEEFR